AGGTPAQAPGGQRGEATGAAKGPRVTQQSALRAGVTAAGGAGEPVQLRVSRHGQLLAFTITPMKRDPGYILGVRTSPGVKQLSPPYAVSQSVTDTAGLVVGTFQGFYRLATDKSLGGFFGQNGIRGPVGIMKTTADEAHGGLV